MEYRYENKTPALPDTISTILQVILSHCSNLLSKYSYVLLKSISSVFKDDPLRATIMPLFYQKERRKTSVIVVPTKNPGYREVNRAHYLYTLVFYLVVRPLGIPGSQQSHP